MRSKNRSIHNNFFIRRKSVEKMKYKHLELMINFSIDFNEEFKREIVCFQLFEIHFISRKKEKIPVSGASLIRDSINRCFWGGEYSKGWRNRPRRGPIDPAGNSICRVVSPESKRPVPISISKRAHLAHARFSYARAVEKGGFRGRMIGITVKIGSFSSHR